MQTDRKKIGILIIVIGLIIIGLIVYFGFLRKSSPTVIDNTEVPEVTGQLPSAPTIGTTTPSDQPRNYQKYNAASEATHQINGDDLGKISMSFAERFGSFSNQSSYGNFTDLKILMTDNMKTWADKYVEELKTQPNSSSAYYGIVTDSLTYEVKKFDDAAGQAEILIGTQRRESTEKINGGESYNQNLSLSLVKVGGEWLFDKAYWEKK
ncbi:MAG: hypothetical protein WCN88_04025 [Candidatus Falkowbacteria bacterium]